MELVSWRRPQRPCPLSRWRSAVLGIGRCRAAAAAIEQDAGMAEMPAAEVDVDDDLVAGLLREQHPDLARLPLRPLAHGWDNVSFRLGDDLVVRLPRRAA